MNLIKNLFIKHRGLILYGFFGLVTTAVNSAVYHLCYVNLGIPNTPSTVIAWVLAVLVAFFTNKQWVFASDKWDRQTLCREGAAFFSARAATGILDVAIMWVTVEKMNLNGDLCKLASNIVVIVLNYVASKLFVFRKKEK